jgi:hypothetical protein
LLVSGGNPENARRNVGQDFRRGALGPAQGRLQRIVSGRRLTAIHGVYVMEVVASAVGLTAGLAFFAASRTILNLF